MNNKAYYFVLFCIVFPVLQVLFLAGCLYYKGLELESTRVELTAVKTELLRSQHLLQNANDRLDMEIKYGKFCDKLLEDAGAQNKQLFLDKTRLEKEIDELKQRIAELKHTEVALKGGDQ